MIPYGRQSIIQDDIDAVTARLRSDYLTQGPAVPAFEAAVVQACNAAHAVAVNSATSALHVACMALGLGAGYVLWTVPNTFVASANCALYCGASVDFVDIDPVRFTMCPKALETKLAQAQQTGRLPRVIVPVHLCGQSADMHYVPVHTKPYYRAIGFAPGMFPASEAYYASAISIPLYFDLTDDEQDQVVQALRAVL